MTFPRFWLCGHLFIILLNIIISLKFNLIYELVDFSGLSFENSSIGMAIPSSVCTDRSMSVISTYKLLSNQERLAGVMAHMIGHNIGLEHDANTGGTNYFNVILSHESVIHTRNMLCINLHVSFTIF